MAQPASAWRTARAQTCSWHVAASPPCVTSGRPGVPVGPGCDGWASTDAASLWLESRTALLLGRQRLEPSGSETGGRPESTLEAPDRTHRRLAAAPERTHRTNAPNERTERRSLRRPGRAITTYPHVVALATSRFNVVVRSGPARQPRAPIADPDRACGALPRAASETTSGRVGHTRAVVRWRRRDRRVGAPRIRGCRPRGPATQRSVG